ncbi:MAG: YihY/virulence factor BrkB family protein [Opitutaceae bacterium]|nr:YihY/virulence factor BrkB family protein [Cytophagales bacterium]
MSYKVRKYLQQLAFRKVAKSGISLVDFLILFFRHIQADNINSKANAMAFNFMLAIFPGIIFLFTLIPYFPIPNLQGQILSFMANAMPASIYGLMKETIKDIVSRPRGGLLSFGFFFSVYAAMNGTLAMMTAFNECHRSAENRGFIRTRVVALTLTIINSLILILSVSLILVGEQALDYLYNFHKISAFNYYLLMVIRYITAIGSFFFLTAFIYYFAPSVHTRWRFFSLGAFVATALNVLVTVGFTIYLNSIAGFNKLYGSIGTIIALMLWLYLTSMVLLVGFEINAVLERVMDSENKLKKEPVFIAGRRK